MNSKLHELLAVEKEKKAAFDIIMTNGANAFNQGLTAYRGSLKTLKMFAEEDNIAYPEDRQDMSKSVSGDVNHIHEVVGDFLDLCLQKESANQRAVADIMIDGQPLAKDVPATFLLGLEQKLERYRNLMVAIPTLEDGKTWVLDESKDGEIYKIEPDLETIKTKKTFAFQILDKATKEHPAQIEKWEDTVNVGKYTTQTWSSMWTKKKKGGFLRRLDNLIIAVKKARQRANCEELKEAKIGETLMNYINCG